MKLILKCILPKEIWTVLNTESKIGPKLKGSPNYINQILMFAQKEYFKKKKEKSKRGGNK